MKLRWSIALATAGALFAGGVIATPAYAAGTETEPNNTMSAATLIARNSTTSGSIHGTGWSDTDYYAVDLPSAGRVKLNLTFPSDLGTSNAYDVDVYNSNGKNLYSFSVGGGNWDGSWLAAKGIFMPAGRMYVSLYGSDSRPSWGKPYALNVGWGAGMVELEPNSTSATATVLKVGATASGSILSAGWSDTDYFAVDLAAAGRVRLNLKFPSNLGTGAAYDVDVHNAVGKDLYAFSVGGGQWDGAWLSSQGVFLPAGRTYVSIYGSDSRATWGSAYTLSVAWAGGNVELEPNSTTATATPLGLGATVSGSILSSGWSDTDVFAVNVAAASTLSLTLKFPAGLGVGAAYDVTVYNPDGDEVDSFQATGADANGSRLAGLPVTLPSGRNYVEVYGSDSRASWGKTYTLSVGYRWNVTATPRVTGTAKVGSTLTASPGVWSPAPTAFTYQWYRSGKAIAGATTKTRVLTAADLGSTLTVAVRGSRAGYPSVTKTSSATVRVVAGTLTPFSPTISGTPKVGATLTALAGKWGPAPVTMTYQWYRGKKAITGAKKNTLALVAADKGKKITVRVTGTKAGFTSVTKSSKATKKVGAGTLRTVVPTIVGTKAVGSVLTVSAGKWGPAPVTLTYRWYRNGKAISRATKATYRLAKADKGKTITVKVTGSKPGYSRTVRVSAPTPKIA